MIINNTNSATGKYDSSFCFLQEYYPTTLDIWGAANIFKHRRVSKKAPFFDYAIFPGREQKFCNQAASRGFKLNYSADSIIQYPTRKLLNTYLRKQFMLTQEEQLRTQTLATTSQEYLVYFLKIFMIIKRIKKNEHILIC